VPRRFDGHDVRRRRGDGGEIAAVAERLSSPALAGLVRDVRFESSDEAYQNLLTSTATSTRTT
jgi:hypothetical protein